MPQNPGAGALLNGLLALILALLILRMTHVVWAWGLLFAPGSALVLIGLWRLFRG